MDDCSPTDSLASVPPLDQPVVSPLKWQGRSDQRLIIISGPTAVGKTKLGIQIAQQVGGEIINADSMQVYKGLPIATNKPSAPELASIDHHLFDYVGSEVSDFNVNTWISSAQEKIKDISSRGKVPIIVGGTCYYIKSLLFGVAKDSEVAGPEIKQKVANIELSQLWDELNKFDPQMAQKLHFNDHRKIKRSLEFFFSCGEKQSEILSRQTLELLYNVCFLWVSSDQKDLDNRIDERVDKMVEKGLLEELSSFGKGFIESTGQPITALLDGCSQKGLFQAIGGKEFAEFLNLSLSPDDISFHSLKLPQMTLEEAKRVGIERLKARTRKYARKQQKWFNREFTPTLGSHCLFRLMTSRVDEASWNANVMQPASEICSSFLLNHSCEGLQHHPAFVLSRPVDKERVSEWKKFDCSLCGVQLNGSKEHRAHLRSKAHVKNQKLKKVKEATAAQVLN